MNTETLNKIEATVDRITATSNTISDILESWGSAAGSALRTKLRSDLAATADPEPRTELS